MKYNGPIYGRIGPRKYFDTGRTSAEWDAMESEIESLKKDVARLNSGTILLTVHGERVHYVAQDLRAAIDAGISANHRITPDEK